MALQELFILLFAVVVIVTYLSMRKGAPYVPTKKAGVEAMLKHAPITKKTKAVDIGSGDGRIVIALAEAGAQAYGLETNPFLVWISRLRIKNRGITNANIHLKNLWKTDFSEFDVVTVFGLPKIMEKLGKKLKRELPEGATVLSYAFHIPNWKEEIKENGVYVYKIKEAKVLK